MKITIKQLKEDWFAYDEYDAIIMNDGTLITALQDDEIFHTCKYVHVHDDVYKTVSKRVKLNDEINVKLVKIFKSEHVQNDNGRVKFDIDDERKVKHWYVRLGKSALNAINA